MVKLRRNAFLKIALTGLCLVGLLSSATVATAGQANIFIYHRFGDVRYPSTNISLQDFRSHLELLRQENVTVMSLGQVVELLLKRQSLPSHSAVLTVDDAYRSFLSGAWPLLKEYGYPVTLFVSTDAVGGSEHLGWRDLRLLRDQGVELGNHSSAHDFLLDRLSGKDDERWERWVKADIGRAQQAFIDNLGFAPVLFAYPYGEFDPHLKDLVRSLGFKAACGQQSGVVTDDSPLYSLPRFPMGGTYASKDELRRKLFMKALSIDVLSPEDTVVKSENPPKLRFYLKTPGLDVSTLRCFVPGQPNGLVRRISTDGLYEAVALRPLTGRRSKYTLTMTDQQGRSWYWYSQLWVFPGRR